MRHGGVESTREREGGSSVPSARPKAGDFGRAVSKIAVAQICEGVGYEGFKESALEALSEIAIRYLCDLGKTATFYASLAGRTQCNLFDIIQGFKDLGSSQGFSGGTQAKNCVTGSVTVREIIQYVGSNEEVPFAQPVPRFPVLRSRNMIPSFLQMGENPPGKHIPNWLPALPDPHTYIHTPMWNERVSDPRADKLEQARQRRKAERALLNLQQRLVCNGSIGTSASDVLDGEEEEQQEAGNNPFFATPLQPGEKEVSKVSLPAKLSEELVKDDQISVLDAFASVIEAVKGGELCNDEDGEKKFLPENRPAVQLKFRSGKKFLGESFDLTMQRKCGGKRTLSLRDEEKDDKKRRAEFILRQCMENPLELNQS